MGEALPKSCANGIILLEVGLGYFHTPFSVFVLRVAEPTIVTVGWGSFLASANMENNFPHKIQPSQEDFETMMKVNLPIPLFLTWNIKT